MGTFERAIQEAIETIREDANMAISNLEDAAEEIDSSAIIAAQLLQDAVDEAVDELAMEMADTINDNTPGHNNLGSEDFQDEAREAIEANMGC